MIVTSEAIEAGAKALHGKAPLRHNWTNASEDYKEGYRHYARLALEAAVWHIEPGHTKTDPACVRYKETGPFRRYLNECGRGKSCHACVPPQKSAK